MPKKSKKKPMRSKRRARGKNKPQKFIMVNYAITYDPIKNKDLETLPPDELARVKRLHHQTRTAPEQTIGELIRLKEEYPHIAVFYNYLSSAYSLLGNQEKANRLVFEAYQKFPDYLFARLNYAQICLAAGELEQIPEIFDNIRIITALSAA